MNGTPSSFPLASSVAAISALLRISTSWPRKKRWRLIINILQFAVPTLGIAPNVVSAQQIPRRQLNRATERCKELVMMLPRLCSMNLRTVNRAYVVELVVGIATMALGQASSAEGRMDVHPKRGNE
jgi:hypothetical protein